MIGRLMGEGDEQPATSEPDALASKDLQSGAGWWRGWAFWIVLGIILIIELWIFGRRGEIEVCVAKQGMHDFALRGTAPTDANRWQIPRCEARVNLGLRSEYEQQVDDATRVACRGATTFRHRGEGDHCIHQKQGWERRVQTSFVPPWDARYRRRLFWFLS